MTQSKICSRCGTQKLLSDFPKAVTCRDGYRSYCKACEKQRKDAWRHANKEHHNTKCLAWAKANPEKRALAVRNNREKRKLSGKELQTKRSWVKRNQSKARAYVNGRRAKLKQATPQWVNRKEINAIYLEAQHKNLSVDHIVPINHVDVCGLHVPWNLQLIPLGENTSKSNLFNGVRSR